MTNVLDRFNLQGRTALVTGGAGLLGNSWNHCKNFYEIHP